MVPAVGVRGNEQPLVGDDPFERGAGGNARSPLTPTTSSVRFDDSATSVVPHPSES